MKLFYNTEPFPEEERENPWTGEKWARLIAKMQRYEINYGGHWAPPIFDPPVGGVIHGRVNAPLPPQEAPEPELAQTQIYWNRGDGGVVQWGEVPAVRTELRNINFDGVMLPPVDTADLDW
jgi:hypothetical protein